MSEFLAAAAAVVGGPEELVQRSAAARAQAQGVSVDEILQAWAGGSAVAPAPAAEAPAPAPAAEPAAPSESTAEAPAAAPSAAAPAASQPAAAPVASQPAAANETAPVVVIVEEEAEPVEPATLRERAGLPVKLGAALGFMLGMFALVAVMPLVFDKVSLGGTEDDPSLIWVVQPARMLLLIAVVSAVFGALVARLSGVIPSWFDRGLGVQAGGRSLLIVGAGLGAVLGVVAGGVLLGTGSSVEVLPEEPALTELSIVPVMLLVLAGGAVLGGLTAFVAQVMSLPAGLSPEEQEASEVIKHRLGTSYLMPLLVVLAIVLLVVPFGILLVEFHTVAPLIAIVTAGGILTFAFLSASRPGMRIGVGEAVVAAAGIGTVVLFIVLVANAVGHS